MITSLLIGLAIILCIYIACGYFMDLPFTGFDIITNPRDTINFNYKHIKGKYFIKTEAWHEDARKEWGLATGIPLYDELLYIIKASHKDYECFKKHLDRHNKMELEQKQQQKKEAK